MTQDPLWVFGYGSLIWNPGFEVAERLVATLPGYRRAFCMRSVHHRGTQEAPGLVLALDASDDAHCRGVAFRVAPGHEDETLDALRARELISSAYLERWLDIDLADGRRLPAVTYVIDRAHAQYCGALALEEQAGIIARARGGRGPNTEYLHNTAAHLSELGIGDTDLEWLSSRVRALSGD
ncbi:gamma-glutamylcyclotransferase [Profundibacterium mesophilum]|uniref:glutathione-specific gamma-glutamylcyclotransferase n=1 Tax=Profundibacterium mesophilum KAUST100406-0324 TaxID=1037889 RepID=A0A921NR09_9RHOB|nr:gamma-glutamylcyclotransferase [Profundibacterium mesophilum]KAF0676897.1 Transporter [Profundibacterium mesophilum KAUST100406-0324]